MNVFSVDLPIFVEVLCSRCHRLIEGMRTEAATSGFYEGAYWQQFMREGETVLCDDCLQSSPEYQTKHPKIGKETA